MLSSGSLRCSAGFKMGLLVSLYDLVSGRWKELGFFFFLILGTQETALWFVTSINLHWGPGEDSSAGEVLPGQAWGSGPSPQNSCESQLRRSVSCLESQNWKGCDRRILVLAAMPRQSRGISEVQVWWQRKKNVMESNWGILPCIWEHTLAPVYTPK